ncbi:flagellar basal body-associated FliL family protein [Pseudomonas profundi]|uniref:flagellar basal body-associated FliL family protein n=1 Tax=Pseudomonas profundi TaxID=1981513 RepID=UPI00123BDB4A|nr:flagellar basal body-associated FliL family protein [Pseudomonas profundi]
MALPRIILIVVVLNTLILIASTGLNVYLLRGVTVDSEAGAGAETAQSSEDAGAAAPALDKQYQFFPVEKVIVNLRGNNRERYFVLDLVLQADLATETSQLEQLDPIVRNSVVANLSAMSFEALRSMSISDVQNQLEAALIADLSTRNLSQPFEHVLVSKMIVQ